MRRKTVLVAREDVKNKSKITENTPCGSLAQRIGLCMLLGTGALFSGNTVAAITCISGCKDYTSPLTQTLTSPDNQVGRVLQSSPVTITSSGTNGYQNGVAQSFNYYIGESFPKAGTRNTTPQFRKIDDYISVALAQQASCGISYVPYNELTVSADTCQPLAFESGRDYNTIPGTLLSFIRIDKKMVGGTYVKNIPLSQRGRCQPAGCENLEVSVGRVYVTINITVPESCVINAGQTIVVDFGPVASGGFNTAGVKPNSITPKTESFKVECTNVAALSDMAMRVQADTVSGNAIVSDNPDVGFVVADANGTELTPNNTNSTIPFKLDTNDQPSAQVAIQVYPVSVTGNVPTEGLVTSQAFLRVDYD